MLSIEKCKKIFGEKAVKLSDEQLEKVRDELYVAANLSFNHWRKIAAPLREINTEVSRNGSTTHVHPTPYRRAWDVNTGSKQAQNNGYLI